MGGSASISLSQDVTGVQVAWDGTINTFSFGTTPSCDGRSISTTTASTINQVSFANGFRLETDGEVYAKNEYILPNTDLYQVIDYDLNGCGSGSFPLENIVGGDVMFGFKLNNLGLIVYAPFNINSTSIDPLTTISGSAMIPDVTLEDLGLSPELSCFVTYVACSGESGYAGGPLSEKIAMVVTWPDDGNSTDPDDPPGDDGNADDDLSCGFLDFSNFCPLVWTGSFVSAVINYLLGVANR